MSTTVESATGLAQKRAGHLLLEIDASVELPPRERRDVYGITVEQDRDDRPIDISLLTGNDDKLSAATTRDALLAMVTLRYTQSNSIAVVSDGMSLGVGAGQQDRVDCVRLAVAKARLWWLRRHPYVRNLPFVEGMKLQDRLNWQIRFAGQALTRRQQQEFTKLFGSDAAQHLVDHSWRDQWAAQLIGLTMASDGFIPFRDNIDYAAEGGVTTVIEPGGSARTPEVRAAAQELGVHHLTRGSDCSTTDAGGVPDGFGEFGGAEGLCAGGVDQIDAAVG
jgi:phosphoribosylaminoimidazolecarboxamide formyltransferase / IMP cyclohydrolase